MIVCYSYCALGEDYGLITQRAQDIYWRIDDDTTLLVDKNV